MSEKQMNAEQEAFAALDQLDAEIVSLATGGVDSVYFTRVRITDADLKHRLPHPSVDEPKRPVEELMLMQQISWGAKNK